MYNGDVYRGRNLENGVHRTQIYITEDQRKALASIARRLGTTQSEVIRDAVDRFIERESAQDRTSLLRSGRGLWRHRRDLPDLDEVRREMDRAVGALAESE